MLNLRGSIQKAMKSVLHFEPVCICVSNLAGPSHMFNLCWVLECILDGLVSANAELRLQGSAPLRPVLVSVSAIVDCQAFRVTGNSPSSIGRRWWYEVACPTRHTLTDAELIKPTVNVVGSCTANVRSD